MRNAKIWWVVLLVLLPGCFSCYGPVTAEDFGTELSAWREDAAFGMWDFVERIAGECDGGRLLFLHEIEVDASLIRFFDAETGRFLGHDDLGGMCGLMSPPIALRCQDGVVTEVFGGPYEVGDAFP